MSTVLAGPPAFKSLSDSLARDGWCISPGFFSRDLTGRLRDEAVRLRDDGGFHPATVARARNVIWTRAAT